MGADLTLDEVLARIDALPASKVLSPRVHYLAADQPTGTWKLVAPRQDNHEYDLDHRGDQFFVRTNQGGRNFALAVAPAADPSPANWKTIVPHRADVMLQGTLVFEGQTVLFERANGLPRLCVAKAGAEGVGLSTTRAVVLGCEAILVLDAFWALVLL